MRQVCTSCMSWVVGRLPCSLLSSVAVQTSAGDTRVYRVCPEQALSSCFCPSSSRNLHGQEGIEKRFSSAKTRVPKFDRPGWRNQKAIRSPLQLVIVSDLVCHDGQHTFVPAAPSTFSPRPQRPQSSQPAALVSRIIVYHRHRVLRCYPVMMAAFRRCCPGLGAHNLLREGSVRLWRLVVIERLRDGLRAIRSYPLSCSSRRREEGGETAAVIFRTRLQQLVGVAPPDKPRCRRPGCREV